MSRRKILSHVTMDTGHVRPSPRSEVTSATVAKLQARLSGGHYELGDDIPELAGYAVHIGWADHRGVWAFDVSWTGRGESHPLVYAVICASWDNDKLAWDHLDAMAARSVPGLGVRSRAALQPPWLGVVLLPGLALHKDAAPWLGDLERSIAWSFLEPTN